MDGWMVGRERKIESVSRVPGHTVFQCAHRGARGKHANTRRRSSSEAEKWIQLGYASNTAINFIAGMH